MKKQGSKKARKKRGRPPLGGIVISAVGSRSQLNDLDGICLAIRRAQPNYRIHRSELMRAIFEAAIPILRESDWSAAEDYESLVSVLKEKVMRGGE